MLYMQLICDRGYIIIVVYWDFPFQLMHKQQFFMEVVPELVRRFYEAPLGDSVLLPPI